MSRFDRYRFDVEDLDPRQVITEITKDLGLVALGVAVGMKVMARVVLSEFCLRGLTPSGETLFGSGCAATRELATQQVLQWFTGAVLLLSIGIFGMIYWRDDT